VKVPHVFPRVARPAVLSSIPKPQPSTREEGTVRVHRRGIRWRSAVQTEPWQPCPMRLGTAQVLDMMTEMQEAEIVKMKVQPGTLTKTRFQVSGAS